MTGCIHGVIEPKTFDNGFDSPKSSKKLKSPLGKSGKPSRTPRKSDGDIILSDGEGKSERIKSPTTKKKGSASWPNAKGYEYMVKLKGTRNTALKAQEIINVKPSCIRYLLMEEGARGGEDFKEA